jgi:hypothetical protein
MRDYQAKRERPTSSSAGLRLWNLWEASLLTGPRPGDPVDELNGELLWMNSCMKTFQALFGSAFGSFPRRAVSLSDFSSSFAFFRASFCCCSSVKTFLAFGFGFGFGFGVFFAFAFVFGFVVFLAGFLVDFDAVFVALDFLGAASESVAYARLEICVIWARDARLSVFEAPTTRWS